VKTGANGIFVVNSIVPTEKGDEVLATFEDKDNTLLSKLGFEQAGVESIAWRQEELHSSSTV